MGYRCLVLQSAGLAASAGSGLTTWPLPDGCPAAYSDPKPEQQGRHQPVEVTLPSRAVGYRPLANSPLRFHRPGRCCPYSLALIVKSVDSRRLGTTSPLRWKSGRPVSVPADELHPIELMGWRAGRRTVNLHKTSVKVVSFSAICAGEGHDDD